MPTQINGSTGVSKVQDGSVTQADLAPNVVGNGPAFMAYGTAASQSIVAATLTKVPLPGKVFDTDNAFDSVTNYQFQPTVAGYYQLNGVIRFSAATPFASLEYVSLFGSNAALGLTGTELVRGAEISTANRQSAVSQVTVSAVLYMNGTTDYVSLYGLLTGTSPAFVNATVGARCSLSGALVRAA